MDFEPWIGNLPLTGMLESPFLSSSYVKAGASPHLPTLSLTAKLSPNPLAYITALQVPACSPLPALSLTTSYCSFFICHAVCTGPLVWLYSFFQSLWQNHIHLSESGSNFTSFLKDFFIVLQLHLL